MLDTAHAQTTPSYQVKAAFIYNFTQFVEWPANAFSSNNAPFVIGVLGPDPFGAYLDQLVEGEKVNGHPITVKNFTDPEDAGKCHILFINAQNMHEVIRALGNRSILTVSDNESFTRNGGMIRFFTENNKIRLEINPAAARTCNLEISGKLLRIAKIADR